MPSEENKRKLAELVEAYGMASEEDLLRKYSIDDDGVPGICSNPGCSFTAEYEPDQDAGFCEACGSQSVQSAFVLAGFM